MKEFSYPSKHGKLRGVIWDKVKNPIATIQIFHGLVEYHARYDETAKFLNKHRFIVYCNDHLGHGLNVSHGGPKGFFKEESGYEADTNRITHARHHELIHDDYKTTSSVLGASSDYRNHQTGMKGDRTSLFARASLSQLQSHSITISGCAGPI